MPIHSLQLINVGPFRPRADGRGSDGVKLEFDSKVNLLIGPNNVGKSTILQALASVVGRRGEVTNALPRSFTNAVFDHLSGYGRPDAEIELVWSNALGDHRKFWNVLGYHLDRDFSDGMDSLSIGGPDGLREVEDFDWDTLAREFGYVGYHNPASPHTPSVYNTQRFMDLGSSRSKMAEDDADDVNVHSAVDMKLTGEPFEKDVSIEIDRVIAEITEGFGLEMGVGIFSDDPEADVRDWREGQAKFATDDGELTFPELSHGTRSIFAWVAQFVLGMAERHEADKHDDWKKRSGIFIVDEIDAHLHPSWQRRVIPTLARHFPNVQIFASTHSPMMVAGLRAGQVHLLNRNETGRVVWSRNEEDIIGWTADEIYRTFMEVDYPTDSVTAEAAAELRGLRNQGPQEDEHAEEKRRERMQELRQLVDRDLLAGGPREAQRELFERQFAEALEKYRQSQDLGQDNG